MHANLCPFFFLINVQIIYFNKSFDLNIFVSLPTISAGTALNAVFIMLTKLLLLTIWIRHAYNHGLGHTSKKEVTSMGKRKKKEREREVKLAWTDSEKAWKQLYICVAAYCNGDIPHVQIDTGIFVIHV